MVARISLQMYNNNREETMFVHTISRRESVELPIELAADKPDIDRHAALIF